MSILLKSEIEKRLGKTIFIDPLDPEKINPNSVNLTLNEDLMVYTEFPLKVKKANPTKTFKICSEKGFVLLPNTLYLGRTNEKTFTTDTIPIIEGRSSIGRLGIAIHITAGFGDIGFDGYWTLEIMVAHPTLIFPNMAICQVVFHDIVGQIDPDSFYKGKYQNNNGIQSSEIWRDMGDL